MKINTTINLKGFISNIEIEPDEYMLPLQEVVVNSIQSIEDKLDRFKSSIGIKVIRSSEPVLDESEFDTPYSPILGFEVTDNGVGFIEKRFKAFNEIYTDINKAKGCKGVGRYSVLACFCSMEVDSTFNENGKWDNLTFKYSAKDGVSFDGASIHGKVKEERLRTKISLNNYRKDFVKYITKNKVSNDDIAESIIHHCLLYFTAEEMPLIRIYDEGNENDALILNDIFSTHIKFDREIKTIKLKDTKAEFKLNYIRNYSTRSHAMHLCANNREVGKKITLSNYIPSFVKAIKDNEGCNYFLSIYVTGKLLDEKVNSQRTKFLLPLKEEDKSVFDAICINELCNHISDDAKIEYKDIIIEAEEERDKRVKDYILNKEKPRLAYRHLLNIEGSFTCIPANATDEKIESELHRKTFMLEQKRSKAFDKAFAKKKYNKEDFSTIIHSVLSEEARFSADKLADLMIRRKAVIKLFKKYLDWRDEDKDYMLEADLHNIIFTMGVETDTMPQNYHNLWLLDERLTFHSYATSDRAMCTNKHMENESKKETDMLIYDFPWAFTDNQLNVNSLVIFEFKRPGRDMNTSEDKKLDSQVNGYFEHLLESKAKSDKGRFLNIQKTTPKFGYIICDTHKELEEYNIDYNGFMKTPYGTLFKINDKLNMYIEVMTYQTMVEFAEKRHDSFFQALGIDNI